MTWWDSDAWRQYETVCGVAVSRSDELAVADWETQVVDLASDESDLWRHVRRSYHSLVHAAERQYVIVTHDRTRPLVFNEARCVCQDLHLRAAGRETRPDASWDLMSEWVQDGHAIVSVAFDTTAEAHGYAYVITHGRWAYFASGVGLVRNLSHALVWRAMLAAKAHGVRWFELGWLERHGDTDKDRGISTFKRGFGGVAMAAAEAPRLWNSGGTT